MDRRRTDEHGTGMESMVQDFDDAQDSDEEMEESAKAFNEMLESAKLRSMSTLSFVSWMPSHK